MNIKCLACKETRPKADRHVPASSRLAITARRFRGAGLGFTLIELLVVIAIIGILSSVVLASLNSARAKGSNAAVKAGLSSIRSEASLFYDDNQQSYSGVCSNEKIASMLENASSTGGGMMDCKEDADSWAAFAQLKIADSDGFDYWCVDSFGNSKAIATATPDDWATSSCQ